ncbi:sec-independent protein translocase protein TatC [Nocardioides luteus]|uniref:Sec-independent protein translocase protein TatC n=1 Tax=Nocardioides luteus TaxID=1844 RepID=A0ABQ5T0N4_9ACTN|nr:twin-arginine translocase subunit TatC [Nocardioides luteus]MDR7310800.1 sec-independent protein translocase protein TatC [Nocardioides luteus]GGR40564.1 Sec-independent protein translocase protein TatC [Nocardioides luteus]GLJ69420.1 Sec-independent protein translocase protein TatC [Nocardioides luteus]
MSIAGVVAILRGTPKHPIGDDGRMALSDHLRELRARVIKASLALIVGFVVALFFFQPLFDLVMNPYLQAVEMMDMKSGAESLSSVDGAAGGFMLYLKLCGLAAFIGTSPIWLYQIWAFLMPGLHAHEKKMSRIFVAVASPLFLAGVVLGYVTLPKGLEILFGFVPEGLTNIVEFSDYLSFLSRTLLVFGIAFEIPVFVIMLNRIGVLPGAALGKYRSWIIVGSFVFAAVATPSGDPFTMTLMAVPMVVLFGISEVIARIHDKRKAARKQDLVGDPDVPSVI